MAKRSCNSFLAPLFGPPHRWPKKWQKNGRSQEQQKCGRCGRIRQRARKPCKFGLHQWKLDRRTRPPIFRCKNCPVDKPAPIQR